MATNMTLLPLVPEKCSHNPCICYLKIGKIGVILGVKTCEVFLRFLAIIFLRSVVLTSQRLLCINCFTSLVCYTGFYTEYEPKIDTSVGAKYRFDEKLFCFLGSSWYQ